MIGYTVTCIYWSQNDMQIVTNDKQNMYNKILTHSYTRKIKQREEKYVLHRLSQWKALPGLLR